jgi:gamma-glutamyltranspeptidase/glutathione hydrolase
VNRSMTTVGGLSTAAHPLAAMAGAWVQARGGNAVDAAVATAFALPVVEPMMSGVLGRGCYVYAPVDGDPVTVDFYSAAPGKATPDMFRWIESPTQGGYRFYTEGDLNTTGHLSVTASGFSHAMADLLAKHGTMTLEDVLAPAADFAERGFKVSPRLHRNLVRLKARLDQHPNEAMSKVWFPEGQVPPIGATVKQPDLARTLRLIGREGPDAVSTGEVAQAILADVKGHGGILSSEDIEDPWRWVVKKRTPVAGIYRDCEVLGAAPSTSGGTTVLEILNMLETQELCPKNRMSEAHLRALVGAMVRAFADRASYSWDPAFDEIPVDTLISKEYAARKMKEPVAPFKAAEDRESHTSHHSHVDAAGNMVAVTQSLGDAFGAGAMVPEYGLTYDNAMKLFDPRPGRMNSITANKKPLGSMSPTILKKDGRPFMSLGSPSGTRIINAVVQVISNIVDFGDDLQKAIDMPRIHWSGDELELENRMPVGVLETLKSFGFSPIVKAAWDEWFGGVNAVMDLGRGIRAAGSDPRREAGAAGWHVMTHS